MDTPVLDFSLAARFIASLQERGITTEQIARATQNPGVMAEVADALSTRFRPPARLNRQTCRRLIDYLFPATYDEEGRRHGAKHRFALYNDERVWLSDPAQLSILLRELTKRQLDVVCLRSGLTTGTEVPVARTAEWVGVLPGQVNRLRGQANKSLRRKAIELVEHQRDEYRLSL